MACKMGLGRGGRGILDPRGNFGAMRFLGRGRKFASDIRKAFRIYFSDNFRFVSYYVPGHHHSPIPEYREIVKRRRELYGRIPKALGSINMRVDGQIRLVEEFSRYYPEIAYPDTPGIGYRYYYDNSYFSYGDAVVLHCMIRHFHPRRVIEIGCGFSSALMLDVSDRFRAGEIEFVFIEPHPERLLSILSGQGDSTYEILRMPVQDLPTDRFAKLCENDILFVDSSHVVKAGSDVSHLLNEILPVLRRGVIIHFHDILWPFEYPESWLAQGRAWNEAYCLMAFLQHNHAYEILFFNSYMESHHRELLSVKIPLALRKPSAENTPANSSLWLRKKIDGFG